MYQMLTFHVSEPYNLTIYPDIFFSDFTIEQLTDYWLKFRYPIHFVLLCEMSVCIFQMLHTIHESERFSLN
jgi:hypothetical protein